MTVCTISSEYYEYKPDVIILGHGNGNEDWILNIDDSKYDPIVYRRSLGFDELPEDYKSFKEPDEYVESKKICPNRCFEYCWLLSDDNISPQDSSSIKFQRKCAGFSFFGNSTHYGCYFEVGNEEYSPRLVEVGRLFKRAFPSERLRKSETTLDELNGESGSEKVIKGSFFRLPIPSPPPPGIPGEIVPPPTLPPMVSPPPPSIENLILRPIILIPLIVGSVLFLILFIYIFRLCTRERADAFNRVIRSVTGRKNNRVVIDTSKRVEVKRSARK